MWSSPLGDEAGSLSPTRPRACRHIGAPGFEPGTSPTRTVRATRLRHAPNATGSLVVRGAQRAVIPQGQTGDERLERALERDALCGRPGLEAVVLDVHGLVDDGVDELGMVVLERRPEGVQVRLHQGLEECAVVGHARRLSARADGPLLAGGD